MKVTPEEPCMAFDFHRMYDLAFEYKDRGMSNDRDVYSL